MAPSASDEVAGAEAVLQGYLSEDYLFCRRWQKLGGKVHVSLDAKLTHDGPTSYSGDVSQWLGFRPAAVPAKPALSQRSLSRLAGAT